jgi:hypothetical protein
MRGIARRLEGVHQGGLHGIVWRELVADEHLPAVPRHPGHLGDDEIGPGDVMKRPVRAGQVEGAVGERQRRPVALDELRVRQGTFAREREQLTHRVEADDLPHERREGERERAGTGADVQCALLAGRPEKVGDLRRESFGATVLASGDALGRAREAVSRRRRGELARVGC